MIFKHSYTTVAVARSEKGPYACTQKTTQAVRKEVQVLGRVLDSCMKAQCSSLYCDKPGGAYLEKLLQVTALVEPHDNVDIALVLVHVNEGGDARGLPGHPGHQGHLPFQLLQSFLRLLFAAHFWQDLDSKLLSRDLVSARVHHSVTAQ